MPTGGLTSGIRELLILVNALGAFLALNAMTETLREGNLMFNPKLTGRPAVAEAVSMPVGTRA